jgi:hypothetical protein
LPGGKLLSRGLGRLDRRGRRLAHATSLSTINPISSRLRTIAQAM